MWKPVKPIKLHHVVIFGWEEEDGTIKWEVDSAQDCYLPDGTVYDEALQEWQSYDDTPEQEARENRIATDLLRRIHA